MPQNAPNYETRREHSFHEIVETETGSGFSGHIGFE